MAEESNQGSERIGGIHFEISAVGADNAAKKVEDVKRAVEATGEAAAKAGPKIKDFSKEFGGGTGLIDKNTFLDAAEMEKSSQAIDKNAGRLGFLASAFGKVKEAASGAKNVVGLFRGALGAVPGAALTIDVVARAFSSISDAADATRQKVIDFRAAYNSLIGPTADSLENRLRAISDKTFAKDQARRDEESKVLNQIHDIRKATIKLAEDGAITEDEREQRLKRIQAEEDSSLASLRSIFALEDKMAENAERLARFRKDEAEQRAIAKEKLAGAAAIEAEYNAQTLDFLKSYDEYWDAADKVAKEAQDAEARRMEQFWKAKNEAAREHTAELQKQASIVQGMIDAQTKFASQSNSKLNIEQLQSINATITRIENKLNSRSRF